MSASTATRATRATTTTSSAESERVSASGASQSTQPGTGRFPITLSTAILSGSGTIRASGTASRPSTRMAATWSQ